MQKKAGALLGYFILFYALVHLGRHVPHLLQGHFEIGGESDWTASIVRTVADMGIAFLFVFLSYWCLWYYYPRRKYLALGLLLPVCLLATLLTGYSVTSLFEHGHVPFGGYISMSFFTNTVDLVFGVVFFFLQYSRYRELREKELGVQNRQSELSFLRAQINPHFLFNQLNTIYALVAEHNPRALEAISGLSELLRYLLYHIDQTVPLSKEMDYIRQYIALQQFKYERPVRVGLTISGDLTDVMVQPLLLIPFVENAFKHGLVSELDEQLSISLDAEPDFVHFRCHNVKSQGKKDGLGGIGIENVRRRLELLYADRYTLAITDTPDHFIVDLKLNYA